MGKLFVVATPIGNLKDITIRALEILNYVDIIACEDTRQSLKLLNHFNIKKKLVAYHKFNEKEKTKSIISELENGKNIAIITDAGTPCISDPGYVLVKEAQEKGIEIYGIPGASACITALSISGMDTSEFSFIGFLPTDNTKFREQIEKIEKSIIKTFIIYESPKRLVKLVEKLSNYFENSNIFIASDLTKIHERSFYGKIKDVLLKISNDENIEKGEYVIILEKNNNEKVKEEEDISLEAQIVDTMIKRNLSIKDSIKYLCENNKKIKKNDLYESSLRIKELFK